MMMKTFLIKYLKMGSLVLVTGLSFLFSASTFNDDDPNPCFPEGTRVWDGYQCFCNVGYRGKCCEIDMETNRELVGCNFPDNFEFKQVPIECQVDIYGGADLEPKLRKIVHINITGDGYFNVTLHNFAYNCIKGRLMKECTNKDCSGAYSEIISALSKL